MVHRADVVGHLLNIIDRDAGDRAVLVQKQVRERRLSALDLAGKNGFLSNITVQEFVWAG